MNDEIDKILMWFVQDHIDFIGMDAESKQIFDEDKDGAIRALAALVARREALAERRGRDSEINELDTHYWGDDDTDTYMNLKLEPYIKDRLAALTTEAKEKKHG